MPRDDGQPMLPFPRARPASIQEEFEEFDAANPHVYAAFKRFAREALRSGRPRFGAKAIYERLRWHYAMKTTGEEFKLPNNYTSRYARKLIAECPEFDGFITTATLRTA